MTTETTIPEEPPTTEALPDCPSTWELVYIEGRPACTPIQTAPAEPPAGEAIITPSVDAPNAECYDPVQQGFCVAPIAEVAVTPTTLPVTGGETVTIGLVAAVIIGAGVSMLRAARRPKVA